MLSHFRKRIGMDLVNEINELIVKRSQQKDLIEEETQKKTEQRKLKIITKEN